MVSTDLDVGARDLGSQELSAAVADFCQKAGDLATLFTASVGAAAATTHGGAEGAWRVVVDYRVQPKGGGDPVKKLIDSLEITS
jgi:hypothetical protein